MRFISPPALGSAGGTYLRSAHIGAPPLYFQNTVPGLMAIYLPDVCFLPSLRTVRWGVYRLGGERRGSESEEARNPNSLVQSRNTQLMIFFRVKYPICPVRRSRWIRYLSLRLRCLEKECVLTSWSQTHRNASSSPILDSSMNFLPSPFSRFLRRSLAVRATSRGYLDGSPRPVGDTLPLPRYSLICPTVRKGRRPFHPITYHEDFAIQPIDESHRFPMPKVKTLNSRVSAYTTGG